jgi:ATP phosphoribosyltransferase regulatory subunit
LTAILGDYQPESDALNGLYNALQTKDLPGLSTLLASWPVKIKESILALVALSGSPEPVLKAARQSLPNLPGVLSALSDLERLCQAISVLPNAPQLNLDLSDLRGYQYHSGVMFAAYVAGLPAAVARGGRYDMVGAAFGRSRPATGFSLDIMTLARLSKIDSRKPAILAPWSNDSKLSQQIAELRQQGEVVIQLLPGHDQDGDEFHCDRELVDQKGAWVVKTRA